MNLCNPNLSFWMMIINILEPQKGDLFVGREEKIKELKEKIGDNGIVVVKGDRGIGKTNLMTVVNESLKSEKKDSYLPKFDR
jgi:hypothetical protein